MRKTLFSLLAIAGLLAAGGVLAQNATDSPSTAKPKAKITVDTACLKQVYLDRETVIINAFTARNQAVQTAMETRKQAVFAAYDKTVAKEKAAAITAANRAFQEARKKANSAYLAEVKKAGETAKAARKACAGNQNAPAEALPLTNADLGL